MKKLLFTFVVTFIGFIVWAQPYGNEWIDHNQTYYTFPVVENGIYRITYQEFTSFNFPINNIQADQLQLFGKQKEIPIYVSDGGDNVIGPGDFIEFFVEANDGWLDSLLYENPSDIGNPQYSLYNDTLYYFLTWTNGPTKRITSETDMDFDSYTPIPYVMTTSKVNRNAQYYGGFSQFNAYSSFYSPGEGWGGGNNNGGTNGYTQTIQIPTPRLYMEPDAPPAYFHAKSNANSNASFTGDGNHHLRWELGPNNLVLHDEVFSGFRQTIVNAVIPVSELTTGNTNAYFKIIGDQGAATDYQSFNCLYFKYARKTEVYNEYVLDVEVLKNPLESKSRIDLVGASGITNSSAYIFGGGTARRIPMAHTSQGVLRGLIPNIIGPSQRFVLASGSNIKSVSSLTPVNGNGKFIDYKKIDAEGAYIILYNKAMQSSVTNYANYRKSPSGGSYNVITVEMTDAWMQYGGGVPKHILGARRAINQIYNLTTEKPTTLLIAGKGVAEVNPPNVSALNTPRKNSEVYAQNLVPSYGYPSSDLCITAKWNGSSSMVPAISTGRVAARDNAELDLYLNKVQIYEAQQNQTDVYNKEKKEWQKQILHFGGGSSAPEQILFKSYLNGMKNTIEGPDFGGNVHSYFKTTSDPFNPVQSQEVSNLLAKGVSLMTFFGHATADGFDQNVDEPANWGNTGKYPMVLGNGCYTGNIFKADNNSTAENFVFMDDLGAIGFLSTSELGFSSYLNMYSSELYRQISPLNYAAPIGEHMVNTIKYMEETYTGFLVEVTNMQFILHGDPGIRLNWHRRPEIDLTEQDIFFSPLEVTLNTDSLTIHTVLTNLGRSIVDTFSLDITRTFPTGGIDSVYHLFIPGLNYKDTIEFSMPLLPDLAAGLNQFLVQADIPSFIPEQYDEFGNNQVGTAFFVNIDGIIPVWPHDYAVVPRDSVVVKASTINPIAPFNTYRFEIDTTDLYNSPFKKYAIVSGLGGVKEVFPDQWINASNHSPTTLVLEDSVSYYWRVGIDSSTMNWREHSFQYIPNKRGWGQAHFFQFKNGGFNGVDYDRPHRRRNFDPQLIQVSAQTHDSPNSNYEYAHTLWQLNGQDVEYGMCGTAPILHVGVVNPATFEVWGAAFNEQNAEHNYGNINVNGACRNRSENYFLFQQNSTAQLQAFVNMIENEIPDGYIIVIYTANRASYPSWQTYYPEIFDMFDNLGATGMSPTSEQRGFAMVTQKGDPSSTVIVHATEEGEFVKAEGFFYGAVGQGVETSTIIGPSLNWKTVYWKQESLETPTTDSTRLVLRGLDINKQVQIEIDTVFTPNDSILNLNNLIPAEQYPFLQLRAKYHDYTYVTPAQVSRWHVLYEDVPEAAIDGTNGYVFLPDDLDSLKEGAELRFAVDVKNISDLPMDSLLIHYWVTDQNQVKHYLDYPRQDSLRVEQTLRDTIRFNTAGMSGLNTLWMEVNPYTKGPNLEYEDQPELAHFNNILQIPFKLAKDDINPILDVTFDGEHILNGDIISPNTEILISLQDENPFLVMNEDADTSNFGIYLTYPSGEQKRLPFIDAQGNQVLEWIPANESNLRFKIMYNAEFDEGGVYELLVQGSDKAGNLSGDLEYRIKFEVIMESSITYLMNYPNPFSTATRFVFTLTGSEVPEDMIIQIMTVTGRIVREITEDELGPIRIGRNVTEYAWDGRDEFGDLLANGVYLYRVKARINGEDIEHRASGADKHFKRNWGKMYLIR